MRQYIKEYPAILEERYAFIDGGYLRSKFYEQMEKAFGPDDIPDLNLDTLKRSLGAIRIFFYDSQKDDDGQTPLPLKQEWINRQLETVRRTDTYRLRLGTHSRSGKRSERPEQKEVDVLLAVDLLSNSYARNMKEALVLTGDLDFRPALEEVVRHGTHVHLLYDDSGAAQDLLDMADKRQALTLEDYYGWVPAPFQEAHPLPEVRNFYKQSNSVALGDHIGNYRAGDQMGAKLYKSREVGQDYMFLVPTGKKDPEPIYTAYIFPAAHETFILENYLPRLLGMVHCYSRW